MSFLVKLKSRYQQIILASSLKRSSQTETMYYRPDAFAGGFRGGFEVDGLREHSSTDPSYSLVYSESEFIGYDTAAAIPSWDSRSATWASSVPPSCSVALRTSKLSQSFLHYHSAHLVHFPQRHHVAFNGGNLHFVPHVPGRLQTLPSLSQSSFQGIIIYGISIFLPANQGVFLERESEGADSFFDRSVVVEYLRHFLSSLLFLLIPYFTTLVHSSLALVSRITVMVSIYVERGPWLLTRPRPLLCARWSLPCDLWIL
jgi:hypothetical protein